MTTQAINWPEELIKRGWNAWCEDTAYLFVGDIYLEYNRGTWWIHEAEWLGPQTVEELDLLVRILGGKK